MSPSSFCRCPEESPSGTEVTAKNDEPVRGIEKWAKNILPRLSCVQGLKVPSLNQNTIYLESPENARQTAWPVRPCLPFFWGGHRAGFLFSDFKSACIRRVFALQ
jgi:hypothetical protein